ncbi:MAG: carboxylating nicotinate-nucleotide diphosphorylase [Beijerinckiaceae bacterium]|nr:carboxylating nicotinate-nucleotide diphosphorylase [Beijerinckiaceae bacterium]MCI0736161.1 carboxylating nicotinate-nucleotide diphosphorylase [Beijerinckiaceae bacterium]
MNFSPLARIMIEPLVRAALLEDLGRAGDLSTNAIVPAALNARAVFAAREKGVVAGLDLAKLAFELIDTSIALEAGIEDGASAGPGSIIASVTGPARGILTAERTALNFLGHLSGIASAAALLVEAVQGTKARITCTRKTTPGLRGIEKYAVRAGGGANHRFGLDDAILIKDNHIAIAGSVTNALQRARAAAGHLVKIEVEVDDLNQLEEALSEGVDAVLLDNMSLDMLAKAVLMVNGRAITEASGRITPESAQAIAATGVDLISAGWLTHSAPALDIGLDFVV